MASAIGRSIVSRWRICKWICETRLVFFFGFGLGGGILWGSDELSIGAGALFGLDSGVGKLRRVVFAAGIERWISFFDRSGSVVKEAVGEDYGIAESGMDSFCRV